MKVLSPIDAWRSILKQAVVAEFAGASAVASVDYKYVGFWEWCFFMHGGSGYVG